MRLLNKIFDYFDLNKRAEKVRNSDCPEDMMSPRLLKWVEEQREKDRQLAIKHMSSYDRQEYESRQNLENMMICLRPAKKSEYDDWLSKYINAGGEPTHWYDYPWNRWNGRDCRWFIANKDIVLYPLYGARSIHIIIPHGIKCSGDRGHTDLFRYDDIGKPPGKYECRFVPVFCDSEA